MDIIGNYLGFLDYEELVHYKNDLLDKEFEESYIWFSGDNIES